MYEIIRFPSGKMTYRMETEASHKHQIAKASNFETAVDHIYPCDPYGLIPYMAGTSERFIAWNWHLYRGVFRIQAVVNDDKKGFIDRFFDSIADSVNGLTLWREASEKFSQWLQANSVSDPEFARTCFDFEKQIRNALVDARDIPHGHEYHFWGNERKHETEWSMRDSVSKGYYLLEA